MILAVSSMVVLRVLGTAQDGGIPHLNCSCQNCSSLTRHISSIAIQGEQTIVIDATPDFTRQVRLLDPPTLASVSAIFLTHLHIGHYTGLLQLGREVASTTDFPLYLIPAFQDFLTTNKPFSYLFSRKQVAIRDMQPEQPVAFSDFHITAFEVPHRNEDGITLGYEIQTPDTLAIYLPDIDYLPDRINKRLQTADLVLFDGTFYSSQEIGHQQHVPHPPIVDTLASYHRPESQQFVFTHFNHSNPILADPSLQQQLLDQGFDLAEDKQVFQL